MPHRLNHRQPPMVISNTPMLSCVMLFLCLTPHLATLAAAPHVWPIERQALDGCRKACRHAGKSDIKVTIEQPVDTHVCRMLHGYPPTIMLNGT
jgi:hypothetical protein